MGNSIIKICRKCSEGEREIDSSSISELPNTVDIRSERERRLISTKYLMNRYSKSKEISSTLRLLHEIRPMATDERLIKQALSSHFLFKQLDPETTRLLITKMKCFIAQPRETIIEQGGPGDFFFVLISGRVEIRVNNQSRTVLEEGSCFGELALITQEPRQATVKALEECKLWGISQTKFKNALEQINQENYLENKHLVSQVKIFEDLYEDQIEHILSVVNTQYWDADQYIFKKGDHGLQFYIVKTGRAAVLIKDKIVKELNKSMYFGELALFNNSKRSASVKTLEPTTLLSLNKHKLYEILGDSLEKIKYRNCLEISIQKSPTLNFLTAFQTEQIIDASIFKMCKDGEVVISMGQPKGSFFVVVLDGCLRTDGKNLKKYSIIGAKAFSVSSHSCYGKNYIAAEGCIVAICYKKYFEKIHDFDLLKIQNKMTKVLKSIRLLKLLTREKLNALAKQTKIATFKNNTYIIKENTPSDYLYIMKEGNAIVKRNDLIIGTISQNNYFGERSILFKENRIASVVAQGTVKCYTINQDAFEDIIDKGTKSQMLKRLRLYEYRFEIDALIPVDILGDGMFTRVVLVFNKPNHALYAAKCARKDIMRRFRIEKFLESECNVLTKLDHPMILKLVKVLEDKDCICIVQEYIQGTNLYQMMRHKRRLSEQEAKFYIYSLAVVLEYMHKKRIIHRDLKLENIKLDEEGYVKLIDFGSAKWINGRTFTVVGTPHYMAPEVIRGIGHTGTADLWSLGVLMYELLFGKLPFGNDSCDIQEVYKEILEDPVSYPDDLQISHDAIALMNKLLNKTSYLRYPDIKRSLTECPWLRDINYVRFI